MNPIATFIALLDRSSDYKATNITVSGGGIDGLMIFCGRMLWSTEKYRSILVNIIERTQMSDSGLTFHTAFLEPCSYDGFLSLFIKLQGPKL